MLGEGKVWMTLTVGAEVSVGCSKCWGKGKLYMIVSVGGDSDNLMCETIIMMTFQNPLVTHSLLLQKKKPIRHTQIHQSRLKCTAGIFLSGLFIDTKYYLTTI